MPMNCGVGSSDGVQDDKLLRPPHIWRRLAEPDGAAPA